MSSFHVKDPALDTKREKIVKVGSLFLREFAICRKSKEHLFTNVYNIHAKQAKGKTQKESLVERQTYVSNVSVLVKSMGSKLRIPTCCLTLEKLLICSCFISSPEKLGRKSLTSVKYYEG